MSNYKKIGEILFTIVFLYFIISVSFSTLSVVSIISMSPSLDSLFPSIIIILILVGMIWVFVKKRKSLANRFFKCDGQDIDLNKPITYPQMFNLMTVALGLFLLTKFVPGFLMSIYRYFALANFYSNFSDEQYDPQAKVLFKNIVGYLINIAIAVYLLYGAPHFAKWHMKKMETLKEELQ